MFKSNSTSIMMIKYQKNQRFKDIIKSLFFSLSFFLIGCNQPIPKQNTISDSDISQKSDNFNFFYIKNGFPIQSTNSINDNCSYQEGIKTKWIKLGLEQKKCLLYKVKELDAPEVFIMSYQTIGNYLLVKYYVDDIYITGILLTIYNNEGDIIDYIYLNNINSSSLIGAFEDKEIVSYQNKFYQISHDSILSIKKYQQVNLFYDKSSDTIYKKEVRSLYRIQEQTGKIEFIFSDSTFTGSPFTW